MDDGLFKADTASGIEARRAASAATGERLSRTSHSAAPAASRDEHDRPAAESRADGSRRGSRSHRSGRSTPRPNTSSRRHRHRSQGNGSPKEGSGDIHSQQDIREPQDGDGRPRALLSCCKGETHSHREGFRRLARRLHDAGAPSSCMLPCNLRLLAASLRCAAALPSAQAVEVYSVNASAMDEGNHCMEAHMACDL